MLKSKKTTKFNEQLQAIFEDDGHSEYINRMAENEKLLVQFYDETDRFLIYDISVDSTGEEVDEYEERKVNAVKKASKILDNFLGVKIPNKELVEILFADHRLINNKDDVRATGGSYDTKLNVIFINRFHRFMDAGEGHVGVVASILHEFAHYFWIQGFVKNKNKKMMKEWFDKNVQGKEPSVLVEQGIIPSNYAATDEHECFCEMFSFCGVLPDRLSDESFEFFVKVLGF